MSGAALAAFQRCIGPVTAVGPLGPWAPFVAPGVMPDTVAVITRPEGGPPPPPRTWPREKKTRPLWNAHLRQLLHILSASCPTNTFCLTHFQEEISRQTQKKVKFAQVVSVPFQQKEVAVPTVSTSPVLSPKKRRAATGPPARPGDTRLPVGGGSPGRCVDLLESNRTTVKVGQSRSKSRPPV